MEEQVRRVACIRCRTQKLKCLKSTQGDGTSRCDRCQRADTECNYAAARALGRPRSCHTQRKNSHSQHQHPQRTPPGTPSRSPQPETYIPQSEHDFINTLIDTGDLAMDDAQDFNLFEDEAQSLIMSDITSMTTTDVASLADYSMPPSNDANFMFSPTQFSPFMNNTSIDELPDNAKTQQQPIPIPIPTSLNAEGITTKTHDPSSTSMQQLAAIGLDLYSKTTKHQRSSDTIPLSELVSDVLNTSTEYLNILQSLDDLYTPDPPLYPSTHQPTLPIPPTVSTAPPNLATTPPTHPPTPHLDISSAFQILIPYVRLVQLHNIMYTRILHSTYTSPSSPSPSLSSSFPQFSPFYPTPFGTPSTTSCTHSPQPLHIPAITVAGVSLSAHGAAFQARVLLHIGVNVLAEIERVLDLPEEARICGDGGLGRRRSAEEAFGTAGIGGKGERGGGEGRKRGVLRRVLSNGLLRMILEEGCSAGVEVGRMKERVAWIRRL